MPFTIPSYDVWPIVIPDATDTTDGLMSAADKLKLDSLSPGGSSPAFFWSLAKTWSEIKTEIDAAGGAGVVIVEPDPTLAPRTVQALGGVGQDFNSLYFIMGVSPNNAFSASVEFEAGFVFGSTGGAAGNSLRSQNITWIAHAALFDGSTNPNFFIDLDGGGFISDSAVDCFAAAGAAISVYLKNQAGMQGNPGTSFLFDLPGAGGIAFYLQTGFLGPNVAHTTDGSGLCQINHADSESEVQMSGTGGINDFTPLFGAPGAFPPGSIFYACAGLVSGVPIFLATTVGAAPQIVGITRLFPSAFTAGPCRVKVTVYVDATNQAGDEGFAAIEGATFKVSAGGVIALVGASQEILRAGDAGSAGWTAAWTTDGNRIQLTFTGQGGKTIDWRATSQIPREL